MSFELDILAPGSGSRSSDTIALRYGQLALSSLSYGPSNNQKVVIIDGGTKDSGAALVQHVRQYYHTNHVDAVLLSHPDADHASGLTVVLEQMSVGTLYMHRPWAHAGALHSMISGGRLTPRGVSEKVARSLANVYELDQLAAKLGTPVIEPFAGTCLLNDPALLILGPDIHYYRTLACEMAELRAEPSSIAQLLYSLKERAGDGLARVQETFGFDCETWDDTPGTSPSNNSSAILLLRESNKSVLFTGDAGVPALTRAADFAAVAGINLATLHALQVPHHGSRRNISPAVLNRIRSTFALISVCCDSPKHPSPRVTNALKRRGTRVWKTEQGTLTLGDGAVIRPGWTDAPEVPFIFEFEE